MRDGIYKLLVSGGTVFRQNLFQIAVGNAIPDIEENCVQDNVFWIVDTFKADLNILATKISKLFTKIGAFATEPQIACLIRAKAFSKFAMLVAIEIRI
ncbi:hypothetical protein AADEFJLK_01483 [Methylovulum psychrotolerans]|uniref:Uncharacterized protein n=1 Tax=Methylovulum psychrotolerans TaxID=1704499 RepID=A0A2S5CPZ9_9GAMM|nr:hypothetical protein AADEFJLK_01483 [Methylovulum psychrotolerans]